MSGVWHDLCSYCPLLLLLTILKPLIIPALILAYLLQYIKTSRNGTSGVSARWMLLLCLFSTNQRRQHPSRDTIPVRQFIKIILHKKVIIETPPDNPPSYRQAMMNQVSVHAPFANMIPLSTLLSYNVEETKEYI